jgi:hypothetical protein
MATRSWTAAIPARRARRSPSGRRSAVRLSAGTGRTRSGSGARTAAGGGQHDITQLIVLVKSRLRRMQFAIDRLHWASTTSRVLFLTGTPMENWVEEFRVLVSHLRPDLVLDVASVDGLIGALDQVVAGGLFVGAPVQTTPDAPDRAGSLQTLKPASREPAVFGLREPWYLPPPSARCAAPQAYLSWRRIQVWNASPADRRALGPRVQRWRALGERHALGLIKGAFAAIADQAGLGAIDEVLCRLLASPG